METLAVSVMGHDKGCIYAVLREEDGYLYLADGSARTLDRPKKKNRRHVRRIVHLPEEIREMLRQAASDSDLVHVLRLYRAGLKKEENIECKCASEENDKRNTEKNEVNVCPSQM